MRTRLIRLSTKAKIAAAPAGAVPAYSGSSAAVVGSKSIVKWNLHSVHVVNFFWGNGGYVNISTILNIWR